MKTTPTPNGMDQENNRLIITIEGELDASTCMAVDEKLEDALASNPNAIFIDCSNLQYISSAGIGVLIAFHHSCKQKAIPLHFCNMRPKVKNVLEILGLDKLFTLENNL